MPPITVKGNYLGGNYYVNKFYFCLTRKLTYC